MTPRHIFFINYNPKIQLRLQKRFGLYSYPLYLEWIPNLYITFRCALAKIDVGSCGPKGLGFCSTQTGESMHKAFKEHFALYHPCWNNVEILCDQLFRAVTKWASLCLWPNGIRPEPNASGGRQN